MSAALQHNRLGGVDDPVRLGDLPTHVRVEIEGFCRGLHVRNVENPDVRSDDAERQQVQELNTIAGVELARVVEGELWLDVDQRENR